jgi:hypothetical protein
VRAIIACAALAMIAPIPEGWSANRKLVVVGDKIALALVGRVAGMIEEFRTNHRDVGQPYRSSDAHSR